MLVGVHDDGVPFFPGERRDDLLAQRAPRGGLGVFLWLRQAKKSWSFRETRNCSATFSAVDAIDSVPYRSAIRRFTKRHPIVLSCVSIPRSNGAALYSSRTGRGTCSRPRPRRSARLPHADRAGGAPDRVHSGAAQAVERHPRHLRREAGQEPRIRATFRLSSPPGSCTVHHVVHPPQSTDGFRFMSSTTGVAARSSVRIADRAPAYLPIGVRTASQI